MDIVTHLRRGWLWIMPAALLLLALIPALVSMFYILFLKCVVTAAAVYIAYLLFTEKPKDYLIWGIAFIVIAILYNPVFKIFLLMSFAVPFNIITAAIFIANWYLVFRTKGSIL